jgi:23S rRNA pseudouridine1911/1915/1917 synthase
VPPEFEGRRLDQGLELLAPGLGLRGRKRLWETHRVLVDGRPRSKGTRLRAGQVLSLEPLGPEGGDAVADGPTPTVVLESGGFAALLKPAGLHTEPIAGRPGPSLADGLPGLGPGRPARLLNRLDRLTSGLVMAGLDQEAAARYQGFEDQGLIRKHYLAVVAGRPGWPDHGVVVRRGLDTAGRKTTRVLAEDSPDPLRWTAVRTLRQDRDRPGVLVLATIRKGARHQIRAHLASLDHPILGDPVYGPSPDADGPMFLHHFRIEFPGFMAQAFPDWADPDDRRLAAEAAAVFS